MREGEQRVAEQTRRIVGLSMDGHDTQAAEQFLVVLEQILTVTREHLAEEERTTAAPTTHRLNRPK